MLREGGWELQYLLHRCLLYLRFFMQDTHLYLVEVVLEKQNLENITPKTFKQFDESQEAITELDTQNTLCYSG